jgi:hypothetical protein
MVDGWMYEAPDHSQCKCCTDIGSRTLSSRTKTVPITILLLVRLEQKVREVSAIRRIDDIHRHSAVVGNLQFLNNVQLRESGIGGQVADFEISRLFGRRSDHSDSLGTEDTCLGMTRMLAEAMLAYC